MICFKNCQETIELLSAVNSKLHNDIKNCQSIIQEHSDTIANLTCAYKQEKMRLLLEIDTLQLAAKSTDDDDKTIRPRKYKMRTAHLAKEKNRL